MASAAALVAGLPQVGLSIESVDQPQAPQIPTPAALPAGLMGLVLMTLHRRRRGESQTI